MGKDSEAPLLGDSPKLLSRVSYLLADRLRTRIRDQLKVFSSAGRPAGTVQMDSATDSEIKYTFEIPGDDAKGKSTLISLFLYDVHEDTALRHSAMPTWRAQYPRSAGKRPIRLCYLITCWFGKMDQGKSNLQDEQYAMRVSDALLSALISLRGQPLIPDAFCRILPPSEKLFSLGQFWQSLKDSRPRLTLGLTITVPYAPADPDVVAVPPIKQANVLLAPVPPGACQTGDDDAERVVRLLLALSRSKQSEETPESKLSMQQALVEAMSSEAKRWRDPDAHPSLLAVRLITPEDAANFVTLRARLAERAASVRWCGGGRNAGHDLPLDAWVQAGLTKRGIASGTTIAEAVTVLNETAEASWRAWNASKAAREDDASSLSIGDMMALAGVFGCVALADSLKTGRPNDAPLVNNDGERR